MLDADTSVSFLCRAERSSHLMPIRHGDDHVAGRVDCPICGDSRRPNCGRRLYRVMKVSHDARKRYQFQCDCFRIGPGFDITSEGAGRRMPPLQSPACPKCNGWAPRHGTARIGCSWKWAGWTASAAVIDGPGPISTVDWCSGSRCPPSNEARWNGGTNGLTLGCCRYKIRFGSDRPTTDFNGVVLDHPEVVGIRWPTNRSLVKVVRVRAGRRRSRRSRRRRARDDRRRRALVNCRARRTFSPTPRQESPQASAPPLGSPELPARVPRRCPERQGRFRTAC